MKLLDNKNNPKYFFNEEDQKNIVSAIKKAELNTSGEIHVHLIKKIGKNPIKDAIKIFNKLKLYKTKDRNGCLILVGTKNRKFVVLGDEGIDKKVPDNFWYDIIKQLENDFSNERYANGIVNAINTIGTKLKDYFPYQSDDKNELPDEISFN